MRERLLFPLDIALGVLALLLATAFRFESLIPPDPYPGVIGWYLICTLPLKAFCFIGAGLYRRMWRFAGMVDFERLLIATGLAGVIGLLAGGWALPALGVIPVRVPLSVLALDALLTVAFVAAPRFLTRLLTRRALQAISNQPPRRVLLVGAGAAGDLVARDLLSHPSTGLLPVGFLDDATEKQGLRLQGLPVLGRLEDLDRVAADHGVDEVIIAIPSAPGSVVRAVVERSSAAKIPARTVPSMKEVLSGRLRATSLRPVQIEDLLRRAPIKTDLDLVRALIRGRRVLVTGAGGSIGSELCRQIADFGPSKLVLLGHGENSIFKIHAELSAHMPAGVIVPVLADVRDRSRMKDVMRTHRPAIVFHAAAHKHVPLMEWNISEAVTNNVIGTRNVVEASAEANVSHFVLVSTDKAVRPTSVMGATKRVAEQLVQEVGEAGGLNFFSVRFGNVLGSRGSVVPNFLRQIAAGGPVTVTHPEMRRYFMTIPEAVQLVLQAAVLGRGGDVFVLDMGDPVKIVDLARDLIRLSGLEVGKDIEIKFTGVRPGEKLYEELFFGAEMATPTAHPKVLRARHESLMAELASYVEALYVAAKEGTDSEMRSILLDMVPDYTPEIAVTIPPASSRLPTPR